MADAADLRLGTTRNVRHHLTPRNQAVTQKIAPPRTSSRMQLCGQCGQRRAPSRKLPDAPAIAPRSHSQDPISERLRANHHQSVRKATWAALHPVLSLQR